MLFPSTYNHLVQVEADPGRPAYLVSNLLFGAACFINGAVYDALIDGERTGQVNEARLPSDMRQYLLERGFLWPGAAEEEALFAEAARLYGDRDYLAAGLQGGHYGFITSLYCNLACPYCFQAAHADSCGFLTPRQVDLGLEAIAAAEASAQVHSQGRATLPKISITGGEPLLPNKANRAVVDYLIEALEGRGWPYSITTNGTELARFVEQHRVTPHCRNIQVTLDGPAAVHDQRRRFRSGAPSFDLICRGLDDALAAGWPMTLRVNLDMSNVAYLPALADFVQRQGWLQRENFYAYVSPVTDHGPLRTADSPQDEADLLAALLAVIERAPEIRKVFDIRHFRGFDYVERMLRQNPKYPVLYRCEAVMGMYIFDPHGDVHVCLEAVGDRTLRIGTYDPVWQLDEEAFARWTRRNVLALDACRRCKVRFVCAGGCTIESFNHNNQPCCMPFLREMEIAWQYFAHTQPELFR